MSLNFKGYTTEGQNFVPHITIGREVVLTEELNKIEEQIKLNKVVIPVKKLSLMESARLKGELKYLPLNSKESGCS